MTHETAIPLKLTTLRASVRVLPRTRTFRDGFVPGVEVRAGKARTFVPYEQLRAVADALHDAADLYEEAERQGRLAEVAESL